MKKVSALILFVLGTMSSFAQNRTPASACNNCYQVSVTARNNNGCGGSSDYTYTVTNNTNQPLDIVLFVEKLDGTWRDLGLLSSASSGAVKKDAFWACNITGRYLLYYRVAGSNDKFPNAREINAQR
jgi:hypothetical protein